MTALNPLQKDIENFTAICDAYDLKVDHEVKQADHKKFLAVLALKAVQHSNIALMNSCFETMLNGSEEYQRTAAMAKSAATALALMDNQPQILYSLMQDVMVFSKSESCADLLCLSLYQKDLSLFDRTWEYTRDQKSDLNRGRNTNFFNLLAGRNEVQRMKTVDESLDHLSSPRDLKHAGIYACSYGATDVLQYLLSRPCDLEIKATWWRSCADMVVPEQMQCAQMIAQHIPDKQMVNFLYEYLDASHFYSKKSYLPFTQAISHYVSALSNDNKELLFEKMVALKSTDSVEYIGALLTNELQKSRIQEHLPETLPPTASKKI